MRADKKAARTKNKKSKAATRKSAAKRSTAVRTVKRVRKPGVVADPSPAFMPPVAAAIAPDGKAHSLYNGLILALGIGALSLLAGSAFYFGVFDKADAVPQRQISIEKLIDEQVAAGRVNENVLPLIANAPARQNGVPAPAAIESATQVPAALGNAPVRETPRAQGSQPAVKQRRGNSHSATTAPPIDTSTAAYASANGLIAEARRYLGTNPTGRASLWCGAFLDMVLRKTGHRGGGNLALGYARYGIRVSGPQIGAIVVLTRAGGGHVGIVTGVDANGNPIVISGNHNRRVAEAVYPRSRVVAYVAPDGGS